VEGGEGRRRLSGSKTYYHYTKFGPPSRVRKNCYHRRTRYVAKVLQGPETRSSSVFHFPKGSLFDALVFYNLMTVDQSSWIIAAHSTATFRAVLLGSSRSVMTKCTTCGQKSVPGSSPISGQMLQMMVHSVLTGVWSLD